MSYTYIVRPDNHQELVAEIAAAPHVGLDTEFMRERHYFPTLALLQIALPSGCYLIDPIDNSLSKDLIEQLTRDKTVSVIHSAGQDIEVLNCHCEQPLNRLFDTQIAAAMLGIGDQISYAALVKALLNVDLPKSQTRTNWLKRPLSRAQLDYAADDVIHLEALYQQLSEQLNNQGRQEWLHEECADMVTKLSSPASARSLLRRVKGQQDLNRDQLAILRELAAWRDKLARERNLPRHWVISDPGLVAIAQKASVSPRDYHNNNEVPENLLRREKHILEQLIADALALPDEEKPTAVRSRGLNPTQKGVFKILRQKLQNISSEASISMQLLANRHDLESLISGNRNIPLLNGWRRELAGDQILAIIE